MSTQNNIISSSSPSQPIPIAKDKLSNVPGHGNSKASKQNIEIEQELQAQLNKTVELIKTEMAKRIDTRIGAPSWTDLYFRVKPILEPKIYALLREAATNSYMIGIQYVAKQILKIPAYITEDDIHIIKELAQRYNDQFWRRIQMIIYHSAVSDSGVDIPNHIITFIAVNLCTEALNKATIEKSKKVLT